MATHFVPTDRHEALVDALKTTQDIDATLAEFTAEAPEADPIPEAVKAFDASTVADILTALDMDESDWSAQHAKLLRRKSPMALATTLEAMRRGAELNFREAMRQELDLSLNFLTIQDFYEGIRAQLIDKDRNPGWSHDGVDSVTHDQIERMFRPVADPRQQFLS